MSDRCYIRRTEERRWGSASRSTFLGSFPPQPHSANPARYTSSRFAPAAGLGWFIPAAAVLASTAAVLAGESLSLDVGSVSLMVPASVVGSFRVVVRRVIKVSHTYLRCKDRSTEAQLRSSVDRKSPRGYRKSQRGIVVKNILITPS